ncbi:MAG: VWA domain-containing protein [Candidatus Limnocylindrales bacterium]
MLGSIAPAVRAADTGPKAPVNTTTPNEWTNPAAAKVDDGAFATAGRDDEQGYRDFGFTIPAGSIIDGITVKAEAKASDSSGCRLVVGLSSGGSYQTKSANLSGADQVLTFGSASDTWGRVWDRTQLTDAAFRLRLTADDTNQCNDNATTSVDYVTVLVTHRTVKNGSANAALSKGVCNKADFNFIVDMSGSIAAQDGNPSNLPQLKAGITAFVDAFANAGGDGVYAGTRFNGTSATNLTSGYDSAAAFKADIAALNNPTSTTPTAAGITTGAANSSGDRGDAPNVMFVVTDGSPNVPGGDLGTPATWLQAANAAVDAADGARTAGYVVKAVYLSTAGDPGDTTLPFSSPGDAEWAQKVMTEIGGGSYLDADFKNFVADLFAAIKCTPPPTVTLTKSVDDDSKPEPGGTFNFTLTIKNTADHAVNITALTDSNPLSQGCKDLVGDTLAAGASVSCSYPVTHTAIGTYPNDASVTVKDSDGGEASATDDESVKVTDLLPTVELDKSATPSSRPEPGGAFDFTLRITNTSPETVTIKALTDDNALSAGCLALIDTTLASGASVTCTYQVTHAEPGTYPNTASVTVADDDGNTASATDDRSVQVTDVQPTISVDKTASPLTRPEPGGSFTFTVVVTNTSFESVTISSLTDNVYGNLVGKGTCATGATLAADGGTYTCSFPGTFTGNADDAETDTVTAVAVDDDGSQATARDDATVSLTDVLPTISVDKTADPTILDEPGGQVTFTVVVTNDSIESVTLDSLVDDVHGDLDGRGSCDTGGSIAANGGTYTCSFTADVTGNAGDSETDTITAVASDDDGNSDDDSDSATVTILNVDPSVRVIKTASPLTKAEPGGSFTFDITVINDSNEAVVLISLTDDIYGDLAGRGSCALGATLAANGGEYTCAFNGDFTGDAGDEQTDIVTATIVDDDGTERSNFDDATVALTDAAPTIQVIKTADPVKVEAGTAVTFTVVVSNTSLEPVWLTSLTDSIHGDLDGQGTCMADGSVQIAPSAAYTCEFSAVVTETETDVVTATVEDDEGNEASEDDDATVTVADLLLDKTVANTTADRGNRPDGSVVAQPSDTLHYTLAYALTNGPLHGVVISDVLPIGLGTPSNISDGGTWDAASRTLTWDLGTVHADGSVGYDVIVSIDALAAKQPLKNVATIDSDETGPDDDDADTTVVPGGAVKGETSAPTLPPTDTIGAGRQETSGSGLTLVFLSLIGLAVAASFLTPARPLARRKARR